MLGHLSRHLSTFRDETTYPRDAPERCVAESVGGEGEEGGEDELQGEKAGDQRLLSHERMLSTLPANPQDGKKRWAILACAFAPLRAMGWLLMAAPGARRGR